MYATPVVEEEALRGYIQSEQQLVEAVQEGIRADADAAVERRPYDVAPSGQRSWKVPALTASR